MQRANKLEVFLFVFLREMSVSSFLRRYPRRVGLLRGSNGTRSAHNLGKQSDIRQTPATAYNVGGAARSPNRTQIEEALECVAESRPKVAQLRPSSSEIAQARPNPGPTWPKCDLIRLKLPKLARRGGGGGGWNPPCNHRREGSSEGSMRRAEGTKFGRREPTLG